MSGKRYEQGKRESKTKSVMSMLPNADKVNVKISAVDYIPFLKNKKEAYTRLEGKIFGGQPVRIDVWMAVQDAYNSAGILVDALRVAKIGKDRQVGGVLKSDAAFFNKLPPIQLEDDEAVARLRDFIIGKRER